MQLNPQICFISFIHRYEYTFKFPCINVYIYGVGWQWSAMWLGLNRMVKGMIYIQDLEGKWMEGEKYAQLVPVVQLYHLVFTVLTPTNLHSHESSASGWSFTLPSGTSKFTENCQI